MKRSIFVTGAASGMGAATVRRFAAAGWFVGGYDVDTEGLARMAGEFGPDAGVFAPLDVTDAAAFARAVVGFGDRTGGHLDLLHNNAGVIAHGAFDEMAWDTIERIVRVNLLGVMTGIRAALPLLKQTPNALCFTTCSASAIFGSGGLAAYSASKGAVRGLIEALSVELSRFDIRVGDVMPGIIDTNMVPPNAKPLIATDGPWRLIPAEDVANAVWDAYHDPVERLHRYVPPELIEHERMACEQPEAIRDELRRRATAD